MVTTDQISKLIHVWSAICADRKNKAHPYVRSTDPHSRLMFCLRFRVFRRKQILGDGTVTETMNASVTMSKLK